MIPYIEDFYTKAEADELFEFCKTLPHERKKNIPWGNLKRRLSFPGWSIPYETTRDSYDDMTYDIDAMPQPYQALRNRLSAYAGKDVNYFSTQGYENERDGMNWHQHKEDKVREDQSVYVLSLGAEHLVGIRPAGDKNPLHMESFFPKHGSLYVLPSSYNLTHEHAVLGNPYRPCGLRIGINCKHIPVTPPGPHAPTVYDCHAGKKYPEDVVYVGRQVRRRGGKEIIRENTPWGNHLRIKTREGFRMYAEGEMRDPAFAAMTYEKLRGKDLLCWCKPSEAEHCHARVWLEIANS